MTVYKGFNPELFYDMVRSSLYNGVLSQSQVDGIRYVMSEWKRRYGFNNGDIRHLAYMMATTHHETAFTMCPITEYGSQSYLMGKDYYPYIGRGYVQLTWEENYARAGEAVGEDLVSYPDLALEPDLAAVIMYDGMRDGWFTGVTLSDYFNETTNDPYNARKIINGTDCASQIAEYHADFLAAIQASLIPA